MDIKKLNKRMKGLTKKSTLLEAKLELGRMLAFAYSAAYDTDYNYAVAVDDRWNVSFADGCYTVSWSQDEFRTVRPWASMTPERAIELVENPAILMVQSGALEWRHAGHINTPLVKRVMLLPWINPREVEALELLAVAGPIEENKRRAFAYDARKSRLKESVWNEKRDRQIVNTGHVTFDRQTNALGTGNYFADTMHGAHIRPFKEVGCNGIINKPGHLQNFDLLPFVKDAPESVISAVKRYCVDNSAWLYVLHSYSYRKQAGWPAHVKIVHGYILASYDDQLISTWVTGPSHKSYRVVYGCLPYLAWIEADIDDPVLGTLPYQGTLKEDDNEVD